MLQRRETIETCEVPQRRMSSLYELVEGCTPCAILDWVTTASKHDACDGVGSATCSVRVIRQTICTILILPRWRNLCIL